MCILCVGIDLAKKAFAVHGVDEQGAGELPQPKVRYGLYAGSLNASPLVGTAQAIRAYFAATAITAFQ
jgi:hypothetical protein